jgi:hypothetical protein
MNGHNSDDNTDDDAYDNHDKETNINDETTKENIDIDRCLLSNEPLNDTMVQLPSCSHKFNYIPLYNEIYIQKKTLNSNETTRLYEHQIKCPYCRTICNWLLPPSSYYYGLKGVNMIRGVNAFSPSLKITCQHIKKKTVKNNKDVQCSSQKVYITKFGRYCGLHYNALLKQHLKQDSKQNEMIYLDKNIDNQEKKDNIQVINELFSNQISNTLVNDDKKNVKTNVKTNKVIKNTIIKPNEEAQIKLSSPDNIHNLRSAFNHFLLKDHIKEAISRYNYKNNCEEYFNTIIPYL